MSELSEGSDECRCSTDRVKYSKSGDIPYRPVTEQQILEAVSDWKTAEQVGSSLWPHLIGRGPVTGGPSSCAVAASFQLRKLEHAGKVKSARLNGRGPTRFRRV